MKYRNNPALRYFLLYSRKFLIHTILFCSIPIMLIPEKTLEKHKSLNTVFTFTAFLVAYLDLEEFEKWLDENYPKKKILADYSDLN